MFPRDPRFKGLIWDNPSIMLCIVSSYLWFVLKAGPALMSTRKPLKLKTLTRAFNLFQVLANVWFAYHAITIAVRSYYKGEFSFGCLPPSIGLTNRRDEKLLVMVGIFYFWVRILDFMDTVFFVLGKKQSHVTFLHVYHHVSVAGVAYIYLRSGWILSIFNLTVLNSIIHVIMYTYYLLSTFPAMKPYLWWKKYLTALQLVQFVLTLMQMAWNAVFNCGYPILVSQFNLAQTVIFLILFSNFYIKNYIGKKSV